MNCGEDKEEKRQATYNVDRKRERKRESKRERKNNNNAKSEIRQISNKM